jgi:hypothetical protein
MPQLARDDCCSALAVISAAVQGRIERRDQCCHADRLPQDARDITRIQVACVWDSGDHDDRDALGVRTGLEFLGGCRPASCHARATIVRCTPRCRAAREQRIRLTIYTGSVRIVRRPAHEGARTRADSRSKNSGKSANNCTEQERRGSLVGKTSAMAPTFLPAVRVAADRLVGAHGGRTSTSPA